MSRIANLWHLQSIDTEIDDKTKRAAQVDDALASDPVVASAHAAFDAEQKKLSETRTLLRDREMEAATLDAKVKQVETRLYGGTVGNPKELESLEKDLAMHKRLRSELDDKLLALMDKVEKLQKRAEEKTQALKQVESTRAGDVQHLTSERESLKTRLAQLAAQRDHTRAQLDADVLKSYDQLRRTKAGRAVAQIKNSSCMVCGVQVPTGLISRARTGDEITPCPSCGRILTGQ